MTDCLEAVIRSIRDELGEHNVLDALARELATSRLAMTQLTDELAGLRREMDAIKLVQQARDILLPQAREQYAGRRHLVIEADMPIPADRGLYWLERDGIGNPFRWTGPNPAFYFDCHLDRTVPLRFMLQMPSWGAEEAEGLRATSDEIVLPLLRRVGPRMVDVQGVLMPREVLGVTRLTFFAHQVRPAPDNASDRAGRQLGVPFTKLMVTKISDADVADWLSAVEAGLVANEAPALPTATVSA